MSETELIRNLNSLFGWDRTLLRQKLIEVRQDTSRWEKVGREIKKKTQQPVKASLGLFEDTFDQLDTPKADMFWVGDGSYYYEILLNSGVRSGLDWDKRLALKCGSTAKLCVVWASLLMPYYALDTYCMKYNTDPGEFEFHPYNPVKKREISIISQVRDILNQHGFAFVAKRLAKKAVPKAVTDCRERGEATVFDCLFSDTKFYQEHHVRFSDSSGESIKGIFPDTTVGWGDRVDREGGRERSTWCEYQSGDTVITRLDEKYRVVEITIQSCSHNKLKSEMTVDINKRKLKTMTYSR